MRAIPQRELRNDSARVLREAEAGETFTVTVNGRAVATLGPHRAKRQFIRGDELSEILRETPGDPTLMDELRALYERLDGDDAALDPWERLGS